jgi:hypothetical protein
MARKPPSFRQPSLEFPADSGKKPVGQESTYAPPEGTPHVVQDDRPGTTPAAPGAAQPAEKAADAAGGRELIRTGAESRSRSLEGSPLPGRPGLRPEGKPGTGTRPEGPGGPPALGGKRATIPGRGDGVRPRSYTARVKATRGQSLFDSLSETTAESEQLNVNDFFFHTLIQ